MSTSDEYFQFHFPWRGLNKKISCHLTSHRGKDLFTSPPLQRDQDALFKVLPPRLAPFRHATPKFVQIVPLFTNLDAAWSCFVWIMIGQAARLLTYSLLMPFRAPRWSTRVLSVIAVLEVCHGRSVTGVTSVHGQHVFKDTCTAVGITQNSGKCLVRRVVSDPGHKIDSCAPFESGTVLGLKWCVFDVTRDNGYSYDVKQGRLPQHYEAKLIAIVQTHLRSVPKGVFVDAGTQVGTFSLVAFAAGQYVVSLDLLPEHIQMNMQSRVINGLENRSFLVHGGISNVPGGWATIKISSEPGNSGSTNMVGKTFAGWPYQSAVEGFASGLAQVPIITLDCVVREAIRHVDTAIFRRQIHVLKIDVEGFESRLLLGATKLFSNPKHRPTIILVEVFIDRIAKVGCDARQTIRDLVNLGYFLSVLPRLNIACGGKKCSALSKDDPRFANLMDNLIKDDSEMDLIFFLEEGRAAVASSGL